MEPSLFVVTVVVVFVVVVVVVVVVEQILVFCSQRTCSADNKRWQSKQLNGVNVVIEIMTRNCSQPLIISRQPNIALLIS